MAPEIFQYGRLYLERTFTELPDSKGGLEKCYELGLMEHEYESERKLPRI